MLVSLPCAGQCCARSLQGRSIYDLAEKPL
jgi:hypothetical protein